MIEVFAIITGAIFPILFIVFGDITDVLTQREANPFMSDEVFMDGIIQVSRDGLNSLIPWNLSQDTRPGKVNFEPKSPNF